MRNFWPRPSSHPSACTVYKFEGGEVTEERDYFDLHGMMAQLGLAP